MKRGAVDFLEKPFNDQVLLDQIQKAFAKDAQIRQKEAQQKAASARLALLTPRERQVMELAQLIKNVRAVDGGALENARYVEEFTALLLNINRIYKGRSMVKILGI